MKYLDEEIQLSFSNLPITQFDQTYTYTIYQNNNPVFYGQAFKLINQTSLTLNVSEIIHSLTYNNNTLVLPLPQFVDKAIYTGSIDQIKASLSINSSTYYSNIEDVALIYRYPHMTTVLNTYLYPTNYQYVALKNMLQGQNAANVNSILIPRIPYIDTREYGFGLVYQEFNYPNCNIIAGGDLAGEVELQPQNNVNIWFSTLSEIFNNYATPDLIKNPDLLDPNHQVLATNQVSHGTGMWYDDYSFEFDAVTTTATNYIQTISSNGVRLENFFDLKQLADGEHYLQIKIKGSIYMYAIRIGTTANNVDIPIVAGYESWLQDPNREFVIDIAINKSGRLFECKLNSIMYYPNETAYLVQGGSKICEIDYDCQEDYYLMWIDRYGSFQSQPFKGQMKYTEKFDTLEIQNYNGNRRKTYWKTQGSFSVNSGWIKSNTYPIYESIFVSPYLLLYDVKNNKSYNVICMDNSYEEKTFKNEKKMLSISLTLEINKAQTKLN